MIAYAAREMKRTRPSHARFGSMHSHVKEVLINAFVIASEARQSKWRIRNQCLMDRRVAPLLAMTD